MHHHIGIGDILFEKSQQRQKNLVAVTVTPASKNKTSGFEINSPRNQTPTGSGRSSPDEDSKNKAKVAIRNARELFEKERGSEKEQLHLVVIGHVDAGKFSYILHFQILF
jgi:elongation factor 1 alpha-like protein